MSSITFGAAVANEINEALTRMGVNIGTPRPLVDNGHVYRTHFAGGFMEVLEGNRNQPGKFVNWIGSDESQAGFFYGEREGTHLFLQQRGVVICERSGVIEVQALISNRAPNGASHLVEFEKTILATGADLKSHRRMPDGALTNTAYFRGDKAHELLQVGQRIPTSAISIVQNTPSGLPSLGRKAKPDIVAIGALRVFDSASVAIQTTPNSPFAEAIKDVAKRSAPGLKVVTQKPGEAPFTKIVLASGRDIITRIAQGSGTTTAIVGVMTGGLFFAGASFFE
jgi:hypothetical protein